MTVIEKREENMIKFSELHTGDIFKIYSPGVQTRIGMKLDREIKFDFNDGTVVRFNFVYLDDEYGDILAYIDDHAKVEPLRVELHIL